MVDETLILRKLSELDEYNKQIKEYSEPTKTKECTTKNTKGHEEWNLMHYQIV